MEVWGDKNGPYLFYWIRQAHHQLETVLELSSVIREMELCLNNINEIYRKILEITGAVPDKFRDYQLRRAYRALWTNWEREGQAELPLSELERMAGHISDPGRVFR